MSTLFLFFRTQMRKTELRKSLLKTRQSLSVTDWKHKSQLICQNLLDSPQFNQAKTILAYFSFRQEPDLGSLFSDSPHRWGFPRCVGQSLSWHLWTRQDTVVTGNYGITEPHADAPTIAPGDVDLILVPCLACDYQGYRLGYGGGYYDRMLSSPEWINKPTIGIVFAFAYLPEIPIDTWDKPLQSVCTEIAT